MGAAAYKSGCVGECGSKSKDSCGSWNCQVHHDMAQLKENMRDEEKLIVEINMSYVSRMNEFISRPGPTRCQWSTRSYGRT
jgi:hypothetical protein